MPPRIWDPFLTDLDRARLAAQPIRPKGTGTRPALVLVDLYRWVFGDRPEPLLEALERWPGSCGLAGWEALPNIRRLLDEARRLGVPVVHVTGLEGVPGSRGPGPRNRPPGGFDIVDEVAPIEGEVVLRKAAPSAFWGTPLIGFLNGIGADTIVVAGESTSGCVRATVIDAKSNRLSVLIPEECVFDRAEASHAINLLDMHEKYADVIPLEETIAWLRSVRSVA